jgi:hypothetical protein
MRKIIFIVIVYTFQQEGLNIVIAIVIVIIISKKVRNI